MCLAGLNCGYDDVEKWPLHNDKTSPCNVQMCAMKINSLAPGVKISPAVNIAHVYHTICWENSTAFNYQTS